MSIHTAYRWRQQMVWGLALIAAGCVLLLDRADIIDIDFNIMSLWRWWPWLLVISGLTKIIPPTTPRYFLNGCWEIFFAGWWYVSFNHVWGLDFGGTWPALVVACGIGMLLRPLLDNAFPSIKEPK
ncbi:MULTISPECIES: LiaI-LiaF-like domain-containing protein [unclassified Duganella]|uniref:LiaF transmembrane domain-containing protein n=1 Tax=unclassified Duganella TaxID=2636909 RepID=UPI00087567E1|nr:MULTISPECIES: DUF5668 domain-containing protein [unclassified Duganella]OEZ60740.1 hypothetical protein DUGA6_29620 [Duganella sp. HH105]OFA04043.1 hypothetical protein DUGA2_23120 [Duganella sp. HH101]